MPNIAAALKVEIARLARREIRKEIATVRKVSIAARHHIADLKRQFAVLEQRTKAIANASQNAQSAPAELPDRPVRFVPNGLKSLRKRLGLSGTQFASLVGVSEQSVYNWENQKTVPGKSQLARIVELRRVGKREVQQRLADTAKRREPKRAKRVSKRGRQKGR